jgi:hypothetical protein
MRNEKINFTTLKKSANIKKSISDISSFQNTKEGSFYVLPIIDRNMINLAYNKPTSILTRYISSQAHNLIQKTEQNVRRPFFMSLKKEFKSTSIFQKNRKSIPKTLSETMPDEIKINNVDNKKNRKASKFYLTLQKLKDISFKSNKNSIDFNFNLDNEQNQNPMKKEERFLTEYSGIKKKNESSISLDKKITKEKAKLLNSSFRRIRTYQPIIEDNWKFTYGLTVNIGAVPQNFFVDTSVEHQSKVFIDQYKLLIDNINHYKLNIITKDKYLDSFKCLSLKNKISYNKALEEACGLLLLLPQLLLIEFYKYIEKFEGVVLPNKNKFKDKYIFDEVSCLLYNNKLLSEMSEYFQNCFDVYLILVNEVDDMSLKLKNFNNVLSAFEKARYDISFACNMAENAMNDYNKDLTIINRLNRIDMIKTKIRKRNLTDKSRIYNYKKNNKNKDKQRKLRIEACLSTKEDEMNENKNNGNDFIFRKEKKIKNNRKFKSIVDSIFMTKILKYCKKGVKYNIITQRINNELNNSSSEEEDTIKKTNKVIKLDL